MILPSLNRRPLIVGIAGPNGAGKSTFYYAHLAIANLHYVNADEYAQMYELDAYKAAEVANEVRKHMVLNRQSFVFETVFSDPVGDKVTFLKDALAVGFAVVVCFIWIPDAGMSEERVAMRIAKGGHSVPPEKLKERYSRTLENLRRAIQERLDIVIFDNSDLNDPYRLVAAFAEGSCDRPTEQLPEWIRKLVQQ